MTAPPKRALPQLAQEIALEHLCWARARGMNYADICAALGIGRLGRERRLGALARTWLRLGWPAREVFAQQQF